MKTLMQVGFVILLAVLLWACGDQGNQLPSLTYRQRELVDTMYLDRVRVLRPQLDSMCEAEFEARVAKAVDSLLQVRRLEEARLRERIFQQ